MAAALIEFSQGSFDAVIMEGVANPAGVTKGTIYLYYASKDDLFCVLRGDLDSDGTDDQTS